MMKLEVESNVDQVVRELEDQARRLPELVDEAAQEETKSLWAASLHWLNQLVYQSPIRRRKNGKPTYRRTGALREAERSEVRKTSEGSEGRIFTDPGSPAARYATSVAARKNWRERAASERGGSAADRMRTQITKGLNS